MADHRTKHSAGAERESEQRAAQPPAASIDLFAGGGEMGALMRGVDWSQTGLGPVQGWPQSLKTMLGVVLGSRFPMLLWWGPELLHLYNDAYRPILRDKHPASLAAPAARVWAEVWDVAGPMARSVQQGGPATWTEDLQLFIKSGEMAEETYFTFSYSPVPGDDGRIGGLLNTVQETTVKVQSERQIRMFHELTARAAESKSEAEVYAIAAEVLSAHDLDLPFALFYVHDERGDIARLAAVSGFGEYAGPAKPAHVSLGAAAAPSGWPLAQVARTGRESLVEDLSARFGPLPPGRWGARPERAIILPLCRAAGSAPHAFLVAGISPHRVFDERYQRFFRASADQVVNVLANARAYEAEKKRAEALAEIDRAKTTFFGNVSHELRTPLTLILGHVEDALAQPEKLLPEEGLDAVRRSAQRLLRLVNSLLDFARIEAGRLRPAYAPIDLAALTTDLASSFRSLIERAGLTLVVECAPLPEPVYVDAACWEKIVLNLLSNAFKFTFQGQIAVRLRAQLGSVELEVRDSGSGIAPHELPHVFERFHRVEGARGRTFEGTGIGLSLVQELVELHGGSVRATSTLGEGSVFQVRLPTGSAHLPAECIVEPAGLSAGSPAGSAGCDAESYLLEAAQWIGAGRQGCVSAPPGPEEAAGPLPAERASTRILIVDDNADMRAYLARLLSARFRVELAEDGQVALAKARDQPPDLVLSDVMMPRLDGFALLRELRAHPRTSHVPVVLLSARAGEEAVLEGLDTGADDYLVKPFSARELLARVRTHLSLAQLRRQWADELERANKELEAFSYSVSHDLRAPLRAVDGFSQALLREYAGAVDAQGRHYLERIRAGTQRMGELIDDLLKLARLNRAPLRREPVDLSLLAGRVLDELQKCDPARVVDVSIEPGLSAVGDPRLLRIVLENLLGNAWKFSAQRAGAVIVFGHERTQGEQVFFVRDNGAGFDAAYASKLFAPFQRLHKASEFEGTGIGLATVQRIIARHAGRVWATAAVNAGATFSFTLGGRK